MAKTKETETYGLGTVILAGVVSAVLLGVATKYYLEWVGISISFWKALVGVALARVTFG